MYKYLTQKHKQTIIKMSEKERLRHFNYCVRSYHWVLQSDPNYNYYEWLYKQIIFISKLNNKEITTRR